MEKIRHNYIKYTITNFFTESFFNSRYILMYYLMILSSISSIKLILNYKKNKNLI